MNKVLINAGNLHSGGGVQVASSFLEELVDLDLSDLEIHVIVSTKVNNDLSAKQVDMKRFTSYRTINYKGIKAIFSGIDKEFSQYNLIFTIFGPAYTFFSQGIRITGFAQAWILYPDNEMASRQKIFKRYVKRLTFRIQKLAFFKDDELVTEQESVKARLKEIGCRQKIHVVHNAVSEIYHNKKKWIDIDTSWKKKSHYAIGIVTRDYDHKNLSVLEIVHKILKEKYGLKVQFVVTLTSNEWHARGQSFKDVITNVGELSSAQCPNFYEALDAVIFPSLLESFSITPFEALIMRKPLFASNREFVRNICSSHATYFDPLDPNDIARVVSEEISNGFKADPIELEESRNYALGFSNPRSRAIAYVDIMRRRLHS